MPYGSAASRLHWFMGAHSQVHEPVTHALAPQLRSRECRCPCSPALIHRKTVCSCCLPIFWLLDRFQISCAPTSPPTHTHTHSPPTTHTPWLPPPCSPYSMRGKDIMRRHARADALHVVELDQLGPDQPDMALVQDELARITVGPGRQMMCCQLATSRQAGRPRRIQSNGRACSCRLGWALRQEERACGAGRCARVTACSRKRWHPKTAASLAMLRTSLQGARTVPRIFVDGQIIGGADDVTHKEQSGELATLLSGKGLLQQ